MSIIHSFFDDVFQNKVKKTSESNSLNNDILDVEYFVRNNTIGNVGWNYFNKYLKSDSYSNSTKEDKLYLINFLFGLSDCQLKKSFDDVSTNFEDSIRHLFDSFSDSDFVELLMSEDIKKRSCFDFFRKGIKYGSFDLCLCILKRIKDTGKDHPISSKWLIKDSLSFFEDVKSQSTNKNSDNIFLLKVMQFIDLIDESKKNNMNDTDQIIPENCLIDILDLIDKINNKLLTKIVIREMFESDVSILPSVVKKEESFLLVLKNLFLDKTSLEDRKECIVLELNKLKKEKKELVIEDILEYLDGNEKDIDIDISLRDGHPILEAIKLTGNYFDNEILKRTLTKGDTVGIKTKSEAFKI